MSPARYIPTVHPAGPAESPNGISPDALSVLSDRISQLKDSQSRSPTTNSTSNAAVLEPPSSSNSSSADISNLAGLGDSSTGEAVKSFSDADDDELSAALGQRIKQIATATGEWGSSMDEQEMRQPLSGEVSTFLRYRMYVVRSQGCYPSGSGSLVEVEKCLPALYP